VTDLDGAMGTSECTSFNNPATPRVRVLVRSPEVFTPAPAGALALRCAALLRRLAPETEPPLLKLLLWSVTGQSLPEWFRMVMETCIPL